MLNDGIVCVLPLWLMWHVLCFRVWIQFWVVIHHCATRSGIQGGGIRGLVLLTLSQYFFQHLFSKLWVLTECLVGFFGEVLFRNKWLLSGGCFDSLTTVFGDLRILTLLFWNDQFVGTHVNMSYYLKSEQICVIILFLIKYCVPAYKLYSTDMRNSSSNLFLVKILANITFIYFSIKMRIKMQHLIIL